jgi:hypothetical protein
MLHEYHVIYIIALIFQSFSGRGKARGTETANAESVDTGARLYILSVQ